MVGAIPLVGSSVSDWHASPCLCLDALPSTNLCRGELVVHRSLITKKHVNKTTSAVQLGSTFLDSAKSLYEGKNLTRQRKRRSFRVVSEVAGQYEEGFADVKSTILNYITYKAVRTVLHQLYEMNPPQYRWFYDYVATHKPTDGKLFIRNLAKEKQELAERVMITRLHLYGKWIKKCDHAAIYQEISDQNLELMRERLKDTVIWPSDDTNTEKIG